MLHLVYRIMVVFLAVALEVGWCGWSSPLELGAVATILVVIGFMLFPLELRSLRQRPTRVKRQPKRTMVLAVWNALVVVVVLWGGMYILARSPLAAHYFDSDRRSLEHSLTLLERNHQWEAVNNLVEQRLTTRISPAWARELRHRAVRGLCAQAQTISDSSEKKAFLAEVIHRAREYDCDPQVAEAMLREVEAGQETLTELLRAARELAKDKSYFGADGVFASAVERCGISEARVVLKERILNRLAWAKSVDALAERKTILEETQVIGNVGGVVEPEIGQLLEKTIQELGRAQPEILGPGLRASVVATLSKIPPIILAEVVVEDQKGRALESLQAKDFKAAATDGGATKVLLAKRDSTVRHKVELFVGIDASQSIQGVFATAREALAKMLRRQSDWNTCIYAFNNQVREVSPWGTSVESAAELLAHVPVEGSTALHECLIVAHREQIKRKGARAVVIFTDGRNTVNPTQPIEPALDALAKEGVPVFSIGLRTAELDEGFLRHVADRTGGQLLMADRPIDLEPVFENLPGRMSRRQVYRLAIPTVEANPHFTLTIGAGHPITLTIPPK